MRGFLETLRDFIRPLSVFAMLLVMLLGAAIGGLLEAFLPGVGVRFTVGVAGWFKAIPDPYYQLTGATLVGYTVAREYGKSVQSKVEGQFGLTSRATPDDPE